MKYLILFLLLLPLSLIGQVESQFNGTLNVFSGTRIGSTNTFTISGIFNSTTTSYTSSQSDTGDIVQVQSGARFYWMHIYSIASNAGGVITCNVRDSSSTLTTFPLGKWSIFRPTTNLRLPLSPDGETNASRSSTFNTLALRVDEIQTAVASATNCEQTFTKASHGFRKGTPVFWNGSTYIRPTADSLVPDFVVVDSLTLNTFKVANCGTYTTALANGLYWFTSASPGYSLTQDTTKVPLFQALNGKLILNPIVGFNLMSGGDAIENVTYTSSDSTSAGGNPSTTNGVVNILKYTGNGTATVPSFDLVPNLSNANQTITGNRNIYLGAGSLNINGTLNQERFKGYLEIDAVSSNNVEFDYRSFLSAGSYINSYSAYGGEYDGHDFYWNVSNEVTKSPTNNYSYQSYNTSRSSGGTIYQVGFVNMVDSVQNSYLGALKINLAGGISYASGFISGLSAYGLAEAYSPIPIWAVQRKISSSYFNYLKINTSDTTSNSVLPYGKYALPNATPSATASAISNLIWTAGTPSFLRSQHGVATGTTDGSGDLTVTFAAAMPDAAYTMIATVEGTTSYTISAHTKATGTCKVRFFNPTTGAAVTATSVTISYEAKDY